MKVLLYLWQLPQNLLGLLLMLFLRPVKEVTDTGYAVVYSSDRMRGGISLGEYAFVATASASDDRTVRHEGIGHARQSRMLGPFYLPVIGLPSIMHAWLSDRIGCCRRHPEGYYHFWTEKWADRLGGVER